MKKTSPLVVALLLTQICDLGNAIKLSSHTHSDESSFLNAHYDDVQPGQPVPAVQASPVKTTAKGPGCNADKCPSTGPSCCMVSPDRNMTPEALNRSYVQTQDYDVQPPQAPPAVQASPVKTTTKGPGCNADKCPSTGPSCCMVSPDRNMTPGSLARSLVQNDEETKKANTDKKPLDTGKPIPHCCQPHDNGNVAGCQAEFNGKAGNAPNVMRLPYCADVEKINIANHIPEEKKEETKKEAPKEEAKSQEGLVQVAPATNPPYINPAPSGSTSSPVKMSIKGKGCTAQPCDAGATRMPCCKVTPEALSQVAPATNPPYINPAPSGSESSPVKMSIKGKGCTAQPCDAGATRMPCCKVTPEALSQVAPATNPPYINPYPSGSSSSPVKMSIKGKGCTAEPCDAGATRAPCCKVVPPVEEKKEETKTSGLSQKPDAGHYPLSEASPPSCKNVQNCPHSSACCLQPGQTGVRSLAQGDYEDNYNKDAKPIKGCCDPLKDGSVSDCQKQHNVDGIPFCAVDGIINNPNAPKIDYTVKPPPPVVKKVEPKPAPKPEPKVKNKFTDTLGLIQVAPATNPPYINPAPSGSESSPVKMSIKGKGCTAQPCDAGATRMPCCKITPEALSQVAPATNPPYINPSPSGSSSSPVKMSIKGKGCTAEPCDAGATRMPCCKVATEAPRQAPQSGAQLPDQPTQAGWNTQENAIKNANSANNVTKCTNSSHKCSDIGGKRQSNSDDTCCQDKDEVEEQHQLPKYPFPAPPTDEKDGKKGEQAKTAKKE